MVADLARFKRTADGGPVESRRIVCALSTSMAPSCANLGSVELKVGDGRDGVLRFRLGGRWHQQPPANGPEQELMQPSSLFVMWDASRGFFDKHRSVFANTPSVLKYKAF